MSSRTIFRCTGVPKEETCIACMFYGGKRHGEVKCLAEEDNTPDYKKGQTRRERKKNGSKDQP